MADSSKKTFTPQDLQGLTLLNLALQHLSWRVDPSKSVAVELRRVDVRPSQKEPAWFTDFRGLAAIGNVELRFEASFDKNELGNHFGNLCLRREIRFIYKPGRFSANRSPVIATLSRMSFDRAIGSHGNLKSMPIHITQIGDEQSTELIRALKSLILCA